MGNINYFDQNPNQEVEEDFKDYPPEVSGEEAASEAEIPIPPRPQRPTTPVVQLPSETEYERSEGEPDDESIDTDILTDARLRLEQGRLYELVMKHDLFEGVDADTKAIKNVQKEIKAYAQERMEIMLGMRQEKQVQETSTGFPAELFPFNSLEVDTLKALAAAATKGASRDAEPLALGPQPPPSRTSLNPITKNSGLTTKVQKSVAKQQLTPKPKTPVNRAKVDSTVQRILEEEGVTLDEINEVFDPRKKYLTAEELAMLTPDQVIERNKLIKNKQVQSRSALPMPSPEQINQAIELRANQASQNPQLQQIMGLLDQAQKKKGN